MELFNSAFVWFLDKRFRQIERARDYPHETQQLQFRQLIDTARDTEWGRRYGYADIGTPADFRARVPVSNYEELFPYLDRVRRGEPNVLWPSKARWFARSSGTTNARSKFIPVTPESLEECHFRGGKDMMTLYVHNRPETRVFKGKGLSIGGALSDNELAPGTRYGDVSAVIMHNLPLWAQVIRTPSLETALMSDWEAKIERMARETSQENVTSIAGVPTWTIVLIERILQLTGKANILEVWPNLELFIHGAVSFAPYRPLFRRLVPAPHMSYLECYNASEGFFALQDDLSRPDEMLLMLDYGIYYEFIPAERVGEPDPPVLSLDQVEAGRNYALVISTNSGLWRYQVGDTVRFTSTNPYRVRVSGRTKHFINAFGEEVIVENAEAAVAEACARTGAVVGDYTAAPVYLSDGADDRRGGHEWLVEFEQPPADLAAFKRALDEKLRAVNSDYDAKRAG
ncbi:MAG: GH3 auxin-responsive promoter family protein, partial [Catalinimonas sp.]